MKKNIAVNTLLALWVSSSASYVLAGDPVKGKEKAALCAGCHGSDGVGLSGEFPNLAGQKEAYLIKQLQGFKTGTRINSTMQTMASSLNKNDIDNLAAYFSSLGHKPIAMNQQTDTAMGKATSLEFPEEIFVSMKKSGTIGTFPTKTLWAGGPNMLYTAITPNKNMLLSTSPSSNNVYVFDTHNGKQLAVIPVGKAPKGVKVTPNGHFAYISNQGSANISVIDLKSLTKSDNIKVEKGPHNVRFTADGTLAYVTLQGGAGIGVIDTASRKMIRVIAVEGITGPHNIDLSPDEKTAYVRDFVHHVAVLDLNTGKVKKVLKVGNGHGGIDVDPAGRFIATAAIGDHIISIIDPETLTIKNIEVGKGPHGIRSSKDGKWLYVTLTGENSLAVINTQSMTVEKKIAVEKFPFWIAVPENP